METEGLRGRWLTKQRRPPCSAARCASRRAEAHPYVRPGLSSSRGGAEPSARYGESSHHHDLEYRGPPPALGDVRQ
jgi:hypothetical protein